MAAPLHFIGGGIIDQTEKFSYLIVDIDMNHWPVLSIKPPREISNKEHLRDLSDTSPVSTVPLLMRSICVITE